MLLKKYNSIMEREEEHRNKWAWGLSIGLTLIIFVSFSFYRGFISLNFGAGKNIAQQKNSSQTANVISADLAPSPIQNTKQTFSAAFDEIGKQYQELKDSISAVMVPFFTGIEVYERK
jgi:hypothetical protein